MKIAFQLTMRGLKRTLRAVAHERAEAQDLSDMPDRTPREPEPTGRRLAARRARRDWEREAGDGRPGA